MAPDFLDIQYKCRPQEVIKKIKLSEASNGSSGSDRRASRGSFCQIYSSSPNSAVSPLASEDAGVFGSPGRPDTTENSPSKKVEQAYNAKMIGAICPSILDVPKTMAVRFGGGVVQREREAISPGYLSYRTQRGT